MTAFQLQYLRFLRMKEEFPDLNHRGHEPSADVMNTMAEAPDIRRKQPGVWTERAAVQKRQAEREFYRLEERG